MYNGRRETVGTVLLPWQFQVLEIWLEKIHTTSNVFSHLKKKKIYNNRHENVRYLHTSSEIKVYMCARFLLPHSCDVCVNCELIANYKSSGRINRLKVNQQCYRVSSWCRVLSVCQCHNQITHHSTKTGLLVQERQMRSNSFISTADCDDTFPQAMIG